jgi:hypothetical protein
MDLVHGTGGVNLHVPGELDRLRFHDGLLEADEQRKANFDPCPRAVLTDDRRSGDNLTFADDVVRFPNVEIGTGTVRCEEIECDSRRNL